MLLCSVVSLINFLKYQQTDPSPLVFDVHLAELIPVRDHRADFLDSVLITHPVKEVIDPAYRSLSERVIWIDVHRFAVPRKICDQWETSGA